ncbi:DUF397 domain-containing protein [Streptomyces sp. 8L]|nr:DUF397 domain-containing protein [Streptomyces sp. 8L]MCA1219757.1 DUF397 domain-containing protein [Streptomyces sp. 8L]
MTRAVEACAENNDGRAFEEVAEPGLVPVRDSKRPGGPVLAVPAAAWARFVRQL